MMAKIKSANQCLPKVSVTIVTYNHGEWLAQCLDSILAQKTSFDYEIVVGDDASTDRITREILTRYAEMHPDIIVPVLREKNLGPTANYLDVIQRTKGDFIAHVDGDDLAKPGKLQAQVDFLEANPDCVMVGHQCEVVDANLVSRGLFSKHREGIFDINELLSNHAIFPHSSIMYRSTAKVDLISDGSERLDIGIYLIIGKYGKIGYLNRDLGAYRRDVGVATRSFPASLQDGVVRQAKMSGVESWAIQTYQARLLHAKAYAAFKSKNYGLYYSSSLDSIAHKAFSVSQVVFLAHSALLRLGQLIGVVRQNSVD